LLLEEVSNGIFCHLTVVGSAVSLKSSGHVPRVVVSALNLVVRQILNSFYQFGISAGQNNAALGHNILVNYKTVEVLLLTFLKLLFFLLLNLAVFVILDGAVKKTMLGIFEGARVSIKDVTTVAAGVFGQFKSQQLVDDIVGNTDW
jgi:hypothetical protein